MLRRTEGTWRIVVATIYLDALGVIERDPARRHRLWRRRSVAA
jgi:hypothetical protein